MARLLPIAPEVVDFLQLVVEANIFDIDPEEYK